MLASGIVASILQFVITGVESERLHDIGSGAQEFPMQLTHGLRVLHCGFWGPGTRLHIATFLQCEDKTTVSDDSFTGIKPF